MEVSPAGVECLRFVVRHQWRLFFGLEGTQVFRVEVRGRHQSMSRTTVSWLLTKTKRQKKGSKISYPFLKIRRGVYYRYGFFGRTEDLGG